MFQHVNHGQTLKSVHGDLFVRPSIRGQKVKFQTTVNSKTEYFNMLNHDQTLKSVHGDLFIWPTVTCSNFKHHIRVTYLALVQPAQDLVKLRGIA